MMMAHKHEDTRKHTKENKPQEHLPPLALTEDDAELQSVRDQLAAIRAELAAADERTEARLATAHPHYRESARNLLHYLALRRRDLRPLQRRLAALGFSSLGRAESHVLATVDAVLDMLRRLTGQPLQPPENRGVAFAVGERLLAEHAEALLGEAAAGRGVRIMVTMPSEAADNSALVEELLRQGMDCMRVNCAHDGPEAWLRMIDHLRQAEQAQGRSCKVVMDLAGPKLRTGPVEPGLAAARVRPCRDACGNVTAPGRIWLTAETDPQPPPSAADLCLPVPEDWLAVARSGRQISLRDVRGAKRLLLIADVTTKGCWAETVKTVYIAPGTILRHKRGPAKRRKRECVVGELPMAENALLLLPGDQLLITRDLRPGRPAALDSAGRLLTPAMIGCTIPEVFDQVRPGEPVWFDDGKIGGIIDKVEAAEVFVRITQTKPGGGRLRGDKGINLPESRLRLDALTAKDIEDLAFAVVHADVVELSFANCAADVEQLRSQLARLGGRQPALVLKIETKAGFENLPDILLAAMQSPCCGVMIARGDLAIECGFERLAEVQEEILWICEAAHVPVIWATQVLEALAKDGMPSRAEISDAAMGDRAECVMLNKGPHVLSAVRTLDSILRRMHSHQTKKRAMLRELRLAHALSVAPAAEADLAAQETDASCGILLPETVGTLRHQDGHRPEKQRPPAGGDADGQAGSAAAPRTGDLSLPTPVSSHAAHQ